MSNSTNIYQNNPKTKIIARLYTNPRFGKGIGNKRVNRFIFNGALEASECRGARRNAAACDNLRRRRNAAWPHGSAGSGNKDSA